MTSGQHGVLTLAFGKPKYIEMAKGLARSLMLHDPALPRAVVTDSHDPELERLFHVVIPYRPEYGSNVRQKMHIDLYSPFEETLFVDSDSLVVRPLDAIWEAFRGQKFGGTANRNTLVRGDKDEYMDVDFVLEHFKLDGIPKFNGGVYYFTKEAHDLFLTARSLLDDYVNLRFTDFRNDGPADEAIYQVAMAIHGLVATDMGRGGMWTPIYIQGRVEIDVLKGVCRFVKMLEVPPAPREVEPEIVHFATFTDSVMYRRECLRLLKAELDPKDTKLSWAEEAGLYAPVVPMFIGRKVRGARRHAKNFIKKLNKR